MRRLILFIFMGVGLGLLSASAELPMEELGLSLTVDVDAHPRLLWLADSNPPYFAEGRAHLIDPDGGRYLGMINTGYWFGGLDVPAGRDRVYARETHFSRTTRGTRTDIIATYDPSNLGFVSEIEIPPRRAAAVRMQGFSALFGGDRYLAVANFTPAQSVTFIDMEAGQVLGEEPTPGCISPFAGAGARVHVLCANGAFITFEVQEDGSIVTADYSDPQFDAYEDPVSIAAVRNGEAWVFLSLDGYIHEFSTVGGTMQLTNRWSVMTERERRKDWRISGLQHLAVHEQSDQAFVLIHQGDAASFEDPGDEVWVFDLTSQTRTRRIELDDLALGIAVSQGDEPQLYTRSVHIPLSGLALLWVYFTEGEAALEALATYGVDIYDLESGQRYHAFEDLGAPFATLYPW